MKIAGIIAEYNPFHKGHLYHLAKTRRRTGAEGLIVVMSGDFVQRGEPAIVDKFARTRMALAGGADVVLELPVRYATSSGEGFAAGGVEILDRLGVVSALSFGCEATPEEQALLDKIAGCLCREPEPFRKRLQQELSAGKTWPQARSIAMEEYIPGSGRILSEPNNILAIEYIKALKRRRSPILPLGIGRAGMSYHSEEIAHGSMNGGTPGSMVEGTPGSMAGGTPGSMAGGTPGSVPGDASGATPEGISFASATGIRKRLQEITAAGRNTGFNQPADPLFDPDLIRQLPEESLRQLNQQNPLVFPDDLSVLLRHALLRETRDSLCQYLDMSEELASRILTLRDTPMAFSELAEAVKTRNVTRTRVNRALLHVLLQIREKESISGSNAAANTPAAVHPAASVPAVRLLGFRRGTPLLRRIQDETDIPVITKMADADPAWFAEDHYASEIYRSLVWQKTGQILPDDIRTHPVIW